jgi:hypothetical protein
LRGGERSAELRNQQLELEITRCCQETASVKW